MVFSAPLNPKALKYHCFTSESYHKIIFLTRHFYDIIDTKFKRIVDLIEKFDLDENPSIAIEVCKIIQFVIWVNT